MFYKAKVAVWSEIRTIHINATWATLSNTNDSCTKIIRVWNKKPRFDEKEVLSEVAFIQGYNWLLTFWKLIVGSASRVEMSRNVG
jgi:hypothetical protein